MKKSENMQIGKEDISQIQNAVKTHKPVEFSCYTLTSAQKKRFTEILAVFLDACNQSHLYNCLSYCLLELLDNASKANAKRIYFQENKLDINNEADYKKGMEKFKTNLSDNSRHYIEELENGILKVDLQLSIDNVICLQVSNNTEITEIEYKRINEKIAKTKKYANLEEAFGDIDQTEGSGLGIISIAIMLKRMGLNTDNLSFKIEKTNTVATIRIPVNSFIEL